MPEEDQPAPHTHDDSVRSEFERAAASFAERTAGRFDELGVVEFSRVSDDDLVVEVGAGTGNFLSLFAPVTERLVGIDLTLGMLREAAGRNPSLSLVQGDGRALPLRSHSADLVTSAQMFHHVHRPLAVLLEMKRVAAEGGRVLVVDQVATERYEEVVALNELETIRDPSHAASRPASAFRLLFGAAGLEVVDERIHESEQRLSQWMWPGEFPPERIEAVRDFIARRGDETGKAFERDGDDWVFTRRRIMLLGQSPRVSNR